MFSLKALDFIKQIMQNSQIRLENLISHRGGTALDFGCGDGFRTKEFFYLYKSVTCFDYKEVIDQYKDKFSDMHNVTLSSDWDSLRNQKFDEIFCHLVFQHLHPEDLENYLKDMSTMTNSLLFATREHFNPYIRKILDFKNDRVLDYVTKYFNVVESDSIDYPSLMFIKAEPK